jgi:hypothetical protein
MALPVMSAPTYELTVPSTKQKIKYRPFLVKEEKALLIAQQSEDETVMLNTLKDVITACTLGKLDADKIAMFDIEYIFTQLRAKSVGEISELVFMCKQCNDPKAKMYVDIDLTELEVQFDKAHTSDISLFGNVGIKMKYPDLALLDSLEGGNANDVESIFKIIIQCIDSIYDEDSVYSASEQTKEELDQFVNNLTQDQFKKVQAFFETMPKLEKKIEFDCPVCKHHHEHTIRGLNGFFQ